VCLSLLAFSLAEPIVIQAADAPPPPAAIWDTRSDAWVATDALERTLPGFAEAGAPRQDRFVGIFYFLWLEAQIRGGPFDVTKLKAQSPEHPQWGPLYAPHHWGESIFGYYLTDDPFVLRKHAQMLGDAGVDTVIFDVTNQLTYRQNYLALLRAFAEVRRQGGRAPQIAFLCPFWQPAKVVAELYRELYQPNLYPEFWFRWRGKPLILADPAMLGEVQQTARGELAEALEPSHSLGQSFTTTNAIEAVGGCFPTWHQRDSAVTLTLYRDRPGGERLASRRFTHVHDNAWLALDLATPLPVGTYYLEASAPTNRVGWWSSSTNHGILGQAYADGQSVAGQRSLRLSYVSPDIGQMRDFFTFRKPQPDYFQGPTRSNMWSWLEVYPQHVFTNAAGKAEQMSVGVAQNAVHGRLGSMSEPDVCGRSFHQGKPGQHPEDVLRGYNFAEQFEHALQKDPQFIFITGWNEWIAGRFNEFNGVHGDALFPDEYDEEGSRDIEPMTGGHGDNYYYQMVSFIRRYKGVRPSLPVSGPRTIRLDGGFDQWQTVLPEFRDDRGDALRRDWPGFNRCAQYTNDTGRNDFVALKVARDRENLYFYARTEAPITPATDPRWMMLFLDVDQRHTTGWEGYDFVINRTRRGPGIGVLERNIGGWHWAPVAEVKFVERGHELQLAVPRSVLGLGPDKGPLRFDFKWADNVPESGNILDFIGNGDVAPNGRFNYRYAEARATEQPK